MTKLLFDDIDQGQPLVEVNKSYFANYIGVHKSRVSQLIEKGLPVQPNGKINIANAEAWCDHNLDPARRKAFRDGQAPRTPRVELDKIKAERARLDLNQAKGKLVDRGKIEKHIFERAQAERDAWIGWTQRASVEIAAQTGADPSAAFSVLDRLVREHLVNMASRSLEEISRG